MAFVLVIVVATVVGLIATRLVRDYAPRLGLVDAPDGRRKLQAKAVPVGGGLAELLAALAGTAVAAVVLPGVHAAVTENWDQTAVVFVATLLIAAVGLADDAFDLRARYKLAGQFVAVLLLVLFGGVQLHTTSVLGTEIDLGPFAIDPGQHLSPFGETIIGQGKYIAGEFVVEAARQIAGNLNMLHLIFANWDQGSLRRKNIGSLKNRIAI